MVAAIVMTDLKIEAAGDRNDDAKLIRMRWVIRLSVRPVIKSRPSGVNAGSRRLTNGDQVAES
jgi:hypothetical protein